MPQRLKRRPIHTSTFFSIAPVPWVSRGRAAALTRGRSRSTAVRASRCLVMYPSNSSRGCSQRWWGGLRHSGSRQGRATHGDYKEVGPPKTPDIQGWLKNLVPAVVTTGVEDF